MLTPFELIIPQNLHEALSQYAQLGKECRILAGGTDLLVEIHAGHADPGIVMDIKHLDELKGFEYSLENGLVIGALTTHHQLEKSHVVKTLYPALFECKIGRAHV